MQMLGAEVCKTVCTSCNQQSVRPQVDLTTLASAAGTGEPRLTSRASNPRETIAAQQNSLNTLMPRAQPRQALTGVVCAYARLPV